MLLDCKFSKKQPVFRHLFSFLKTWLNQTCSRCVRGIKESGLMNLAQCDHRLGNSNFFECLNLKALKIRCIL